MKEQKLYVCELCGTSYKDKAVCKTCEDGHVKPVKIKEGRYLPLKDNKKGYPDKLYVTMADGTVQIYHR